MFFDSNIIKRFFNWVDRCFGVDSYRYLKKAGFKTGGSSPASDEQHFTTLQEKARSLMPPDGNVKLHLGCGKNHFDGYINIDLRQTSATDLECDISKLPFDDASVQLIETYHVIEHLPRHDVPKALDEWHRVLVEDGQLIIECPDFDGAVMEYIDGNESRIDNIFGLQRFEGDTHLFGYNLKRLRDLLERAGFKEIKGREPQDYHCELEPCLRVEARK
jgi:predicted SAM-dependent methyltransferase